MYLSPIPEWSMEPRVIIEFCCLGLCGPFVDDPDKTKDRPVFYFRKRWMVLSKNKEEKGGWFLIQFRAIQHNVELSMTKKQNHMNWVVFEIKSNTINKTLKLITITINPRYLLEKEATLTEFFWKAIVIFYKFI